MIKRSCFTSITVGFISLLLLVESAPADLMNGDFSAFRVLHYIGFFPLASPLAISEI
jgi:hypothetical protein